MPIDEAKLEHFLSWDGAVGRSFKDRIDEYLDVVRANVPFDIENGSQEHILTALGESHSEIPLTSLEAKVGTHPDEDKDGYARMVHNGTAPHVILPIAPGKSLKFRVAGRVIYARRVAHPGTRPDPFLTKWLGVLTKR